MNDEGGPPAVQSDSHLPRKIFHLIAASIIPTLYYLQVFDWRTSAALVAAATAVWAGADYYRMFNPRFNRFAIGVLGPLLKTREQNEITASSHLLIASSIVILLLERHIACASLFFIALGDPAAAVVGKRYGRRRLANGKSVEGSVALFTVCLAAGYGVTGSWALAASGALAAALAELLLTRVDDNLSVPLASGAVMTAVAMGLR